MSAHNIVFLRSNFTEALIEPQSKTVLYLRQNQSPVGTALNGGSKQYLSMEMNSNKQLPKVRESPKMHMEATQNRQFIHPIVGDSICSEKGKTHV